MVSITVAGTRSAAFPALVFPFLLPVLFTIAAVLWFTTFTAIFILIIWAISMLIIVVVLISVVLLICASDVCWDFHASITSTSLKTPKTHQPVPEILTAVVNSVFTSVLLNKIKVIWLSWCAFNYATVDVKCPDSVCTLTDDSVILDSHIQLHVISVATLLKVSLPLNCLFGHFKLFFLYGWGMTSWGLLYLLNWFRICLFFRWLWIIFLLCWNFWMLQRFVRSFDVDISRPRIYMSRSCVNVRVNKFWSCIGDPLNIVELSFRRFILLVRVWLR